MTVRPSMYVRLLIGVFMLFYFRVSVMYLTRELCVFHGLRYFGIFASSLRRDEEDARPLRSAPGLGVLSLPPCVVR